VIPANFLAVLGFIDIPPVERIQKYSFDIMTANAENQIDLKVRKNGVELRRKLIQMQRKFASCDDPLFLQVSTQQTITCHGLGGDFFSATGGSFLGANQRSVG
jgi:hypothetical protein